MHIKVRTLILLGGCFLLLCGCRENISQPPLVEMQAICGRDNGVAPFVRIPIYQARVPLTWERQDPPTTVSIADTTKALCTLYIHDNLGSIRITIHNFPYATAAARIAPSAQVRRWQQQFTSLELASLLTTPQAFNGFSGLVFKASGSVGGATASVMGWALALAPQHDATLAFLLMDGGDAENIARWQQQRADLTIKATGPRDLMMRHQRTIIAFARSLELIEGIPN